ncbi:MAG TPA: UDP-4-amino-4,6-dideoxy-N-acetyl-beta-L-altrosamine transaminase [Alphaproteobacteria bacterium]|nr:UDP-4-amino-4,6-dideoxy-N-acetyl-beta-L-altrosamine transaminase [Alphaproteobacteria bacterium]
MDEVKTGSQPFLPYGRQQIEEDDVAAVAAALRSDWLTTGPAVEAFEAALAEAVGAPHAVVCNSGTAALHLSVLALGLGPGDRAVVPSVTFVATANAVRYVGAEVVFADVDPDTGLMGPEQLEAAIRGAGPGGPLRAVLPVHLAGQCADPAALRAVADRHGLAVVEDASHAVGTRYRAEGRDRAVGACAHSELTVFSFHPVKTVAMGEGGAVTTRDPALADRLRSLRSHGLERRPDRFTDPALAFTGGAPNPWYYELPELGLNYRAPDINCALGLSQLRKLRRFADRRAALVGRYRALLAELAPAVRPMPQAPGCDPAWHLFVVLADFGGRLPERAEVVERLRRRGIGSQVHYIPVPWQPYYRGRYGMPALPGAAAYYRRCLSLPLYPGLADSDVDRVVAALRGAASL